MTPSAMGPRYRERGGSDPPKYRLTVMAEYGAESIWVQPLSGGARDNVSPDELPLSASLRSRIDAWTKAFQDTLNDDDPASSDFPSVAAKQAFVIEGAAITKELQLELGPDYEVVYDDYVSGGQ